MKKKPLLFALLALAIVTSLTAGTLAVYTKSVELTGDVKVKRFAFDAKGGNATGEHAIRLAPTETETYSFEVTNFEGNSQAAEVPLEYTISVDIDGADEMVGLTAILKKGDTVLGSTTNGSFITKDTFSEVLRLPKDVKTTDKYVVTLTWQDVATDATQSNVGKAAKQYNSGLKVTVNAVQSLTANNGNGNGNNGNPGNSGNGGGAGNTGGGN